MSRSDRPTGRLALAGLAAMLATSGAAAQGSSLPAAIEPGASVYWASVYEGGSDPFRERVVATGKDWVIYQTIFEGDEDKSPSSDDSFVLFSGIDYRGCAEGPLANEAERKAIAALRPFKAGDTVELGSMTQKPVLRVGEATDVFLMGQKRAAHDILIDYEDDELDERLVVLDELPLTVKIEWAENTEDRVMLVSGPKNTELKPIDAGQLGVCAALLGEGQN